jgi:hypothetical protein
MPNIHTPERLPSESQAEYRKRRRASRDEVRRMRVKGKGGIRAALIAAAAEMMRLRGAFNRRA